MTKVAQETLESKSLWYRYKTRVWLQVSGQTMVVHNTMRVLRAIHNSGELAYISVPITSGKFLYELKLRHPLMRKKAQINAAIEHNYRMGWDFVKDLQQRRDCPILYPADMVPVHQQWEQAHFQALWLSIIAEKCTEVHMSEGWEYSNGGSEEFTHVIQLQLGIPRHESLIFFNTKEKEETERERMRSIKTYDHQGNPLTLDDGIRAIEGSLSWIKNQGFEAKTLENCLQLLRWTDNMLSEGFYQ